MNRLGLFGLAATATAALACSHPAPPTTPLPPDPAAPVADTKPATPPPAPAKPPEPPPAAPHDTEIAAAASTVKLVNPGKGKRAAIKIAPAAGAKTPVELHIDFTATQGLQTQFTPTMILKGDVETTSAEKDKDAQWKLAVTGSATHYGEKVAPVAALETGLTDAIGMTLLGSVASNGVAGKVTLHHEKISFLGAQLMDLLSVTWLPLWPTLPAEPIAPGAKWQAVSSFKLAGQLDVTETVDYELVARKDKTWTIKGTSKITGADQTLEHAPVTGITGGGTLMATLTDGELIPTLHGTRAAKFSVSAQGQTINFDLELANDVGVDAAQLQFHSPSAVPAAAPAAPAAPAGK